MKLNLVAKICLGLALFLTGGALLASAAGFVSYEDDNKIIVWDSVKMVGKGLRMTPEGVNDLKDVEDGKVEIMGKDLYVRSFMGFDCPNYPQDTNCSIAIGNVGGFGLFLKAAVLKGEDLRLNSPKGFNLNTNGLKTTIMGNVYLTDDKNLIMTDFTPLPTAESKTVMVNTLHAAKIGGGPADTLEVLNGLEFGPAAVFDPQRSIILNLQ
jgi:hypothetical protein